MGSGENLRWEMKKKKITGRARGRDGFTTKGLQMVLNGVVANKKVVETEKGAGGRTYEQEGKRKGSNAGEDRQMKKKKRQ